MKIINFEKKKMLPVTNKGYTLYHNQVNCHIYRKKKKSFGIIGDRCHYTDKYRGKTHSICSLQYGIPKKIFSQRTKQ